MKTYNIALIPGDGIGPEVVAEGLKALNAVAEKYKFKNGDKVALKGIK